MKNILITGIFGQDGSYICEIASNKGYNVWGIAKSELGVQSRKNKLELDKKKVRYKLLEVDIYNYESIKETISQLKPEEIYHMAAIHVSSESQGIREQDLFNKNVRATANILEACLTCSPKTRVVVAGSCLMFDKSMTNIQNEEIKFESDSLYGIAKITENNLVKYYRNKGLFACTAILYNHESHRRAEKFVTKKIVKNLIRVKKKEIDKIKLGNIEVKKDWGFAGDYANAMYLMLKGKEPKDYIVSSGELHSIREFIDVCSRKLEIEDWESYIEYDETIISRIVTNQLLGDSRLIRSDLGWEQKVNFENLIQEMIDYELGDCNV